MREIQNLLNQVSIITKKNSEFLDATGGRFNMFRMLGVDHYENTHSAILAELLNPIGSHGLKELFLKAFLDIQTKKHQLSFEEFACRFDCKKAKVYTEYPTHDGRIDILIEDTEGHAIIIENKIYAGDQWEQLRRYDQFALRNYLRRENYQIFYLTMNGTEASENSCRGVSYSQISYSKYIIEWLEQCVNLASRFPLVRETINQYINHLKKLTNQDMNKKNIDEILDVLSKRENISSVFAISNNIVNLKNKIINECLVPQLIEIETEFKIDYLRPPSDSHDFVNTPWCSPFKFRIPTWKKYSIYSEFGATNLQRLDIGFACMEENNETLDSLKKIIGSKNSHKWFAFKGFKPHYNWGEEAFIAILNGQMKQIIKSEIEWMLEQTKNLAM